jgi:hypothetical protein
MPCTLCNQPKDGERPRMPRGLRRCLIATRVRSNNMAVEIFLVLVVSATCAAVGWGVVYITAKF